jgi:hypothetical protein
MARPCSRPSSGKYETFQEVVLKSGSEPEQRYSKAHTPKNHDNTTYALHPPTNPATRSFRKSQIEVRSHPCYRSSTAKYEPFQGEILKSGSEPEPEPEPEQRYSRGHKPKNHDNTTYAPHPPSNPATRLFRKSQIEVRLKQQHPNKRSENIPRRMLLKERMYLNDICSCTVCKP